MGEGSGRSPPRPRPRPGRPSLGRSDCNRRDPVFCEPLADHTRPVQRVAPMPAAPATSPPPSRRRGDVHPAGPPAALPDPAALSPTSSAASLAGRPGSKRADTGKFWGREGRALKGPRPLFTGGVGEPRRYRSWNGMGRTLSYCVLSGWLRCSRSSSVPLSTLTRKKSPPVACGSRGSFPHLLSVFRDKCRYVCVQMSKPAQRTQGATAAKCLTV